MNDHLEQISLHVHPFHEVELLVIRPSSGYYFNNFWFSLFIKKYGSMEKLNQKFLKSCNEEDLITHLIRETKLAADDRLLPTFY